MWGRVLDVINHAKFQLNRFRGFGAPGAGRKSLSPVDWRYRPYNSVRTKVLCCDWVWSCHNEHSVAASRVVMVLWCYEQKDGGVLSYRCCTEWSRKKIAQSLTHRHFATVCSRIHSSCCQLISKHFGETAWFFCKRLQNDGALNFAQFFLDHPVVASSVFDGDCRTIFTGAKRHTYVDPDYSYTDTETKLIQQHKQMYIDLIEAMRRKRLGHLSAMWVSR